MAKRIFDIFFSLVGLLILGPSLIVMAVLIWVDSGLPIFYRGIRTGRDGRPFRIYKFRTMVRNAEQLGGPSTGKNDPRVTRIGAFLRRYKLDELPQIFNVIDGEMSIVGPRPEVPEYTTLYEGDEKLILTVRPGITDYASIRFVNLAEILASEDVDRTYEEKVRPEKNKLRVKYVNDQNLRVDLKIILLTLLSIIRRKSWNT